METGTICYRPMVTRPIAKNVHFLCARPLRLAFRTPTTVAAGDARIHASPSYSGFGGRMRFFATFAVLPLLLIPAAAQTSDAQRAGVFITDSQSWQMTGNSGGFERCLSRPFERRRPTANRGDHQDLRRTMPSSSHQQQTGQSRLHCCARP
jgi:hypothetical protein